MPMDMGLTPPERPWCSATANPVGPCRAYPPYTQACQQPQDNRACRRRPPRARMRRSRSLRRRRDASRIRRPARSNAPASCSPGGVCGGRPRPARPSLSTRASDAFCNAARSSPYGGLGPSAVSRRARRAPAQSPPSTPPSVAAASRVLHRGGVELDALVGGPDGARSDPLERQCV